MIVVFVVFFRFESSMVLRFEMRIHIIMIEFGHRWVFPCPAVKCSYLAKKGF